jgi:hypothetical protein
MNAPSKRRRAARPAGLLASDFIREPLGSQGERFDAPRAQLEELFQSLDDLEPAELGWSFLGQDVGEIIAVFDGLVRDPTAALALEDVEECISQDLLDIPAVERLAERFEAGSQRR